MTTRQSLSPVVIGMWWATIVVCACAWAWVPSPKPAPKPYDSTDSPPMRSGLHVKVDALTGCQYLTTSLGGVTPRLSENGKHLCTKGTEK